MTDQQPFGIDAQAIPPAPWHLQGEACLSLWRVPTRLLPGAGAAPLALGGSTLVVTVWARYAPGGTLHYDEFVLATPVRGARLFPPTATAQRIWVNDAVSAAGGQRLWAMPKALARFDHEPGRDARAFQGRLSVEGEPLAGLRFEPGRRWPGTPSLGGVLVQPGPDGPVRTRCTARGTLVSGKAYWDFAPSGPLACLYGRRPLLSVRLLDLRLSFGL